MLSDLKVNNANIKASIRPIGFLLFVVLFGIIGVNFGSSKVKSTNDLLASSKEQETLLSQKLDGLKQNPLGSLESANSLVIALPDKNPIMVAISQIKRFSVDRNVVVNSLEVSNPKSANDINSVQLVTGLSAENLTDLLTFVNEIPGLAPVTNIYEFKVGKSGENSFQATLSIEVFWSKFPKTIPAVTEPLTDLTPDQIKVVEAASLLKVPEYHVLEPVFSTDRENPFE